MVFYFSATGNSEYVAKRIIEATDDKMISITECLQKEDFSFELEENENIGFVTPTYYWGIPTVVREFLKKFKIKQKENHYIYHVLTYGSIVGEAHKMMDNHLQSNDLSLDAKYIVQMVDNWTPFFDVTNKEKNEKMLTKAEKEIDKVIAQIIAKAMGDFNDRKLLFSKLVWKFYELRRKTKNFTVDNQCIGCSLCESKCPSFAIQMKDEKPVWVKDKCTICLACLHHCPVFAIQYEKNTRKHGQFINPNL